MVNEYNHHKDPKGMIGFVFLTHPLGHSARENRSQGYLGSKKMKVVVRGGSLYGCITSGPLVLFSLFFF